MKKKRLKCIALIFSFLLTMFPLQVSAAEAEKLTKEFTLTVSEMKEARKQAEETFVKVLKEQGKEYGLKDIECELVHTKYLDKKEKRMELKEEPKAAMTEGGVEYTLKSSEKTERVKVEAVDQTVTAYDDYDYAVTAADVPETKTVTETNHVTGVQEQVVCNFTGISDAGTATVEDTMTVTFTDYDSAYYEWNGELIPHNSEVPPLAGFEDSLLASVGAGEGSTVTGYCWSGDPYVVDGVTYRDAAVTVQQKVQMYRANYIGRITTPEKKEVVYQAIYETPDKGGDKELTVRAVAVYEEVKKSYMPYIIAAGAGLAVAAGLTALILVILSKKKKEEQK